jgi:hypothetical protein
MASQFASVAFSPEGRILFALSTEALFRNIYCVRRIIKRLLQIGGTNALAAPASRDAVLPSFQSVSDLIADHFQLASGMSCDNNCMQTPSFAGCSLNATLSSRQLTMR